MKNAIRTLTAAGLLAGEPARLGLRGRNQDRLHREAARGALVPGRVEVRRPGRQGEGVHGRQDRRRGWREGPCGHRQPRRAGCPGLHHLHPGREARAGARRQGPCQQPQDDDGRRPTRGRRRQAARRRAPHGHLGHQDRRAGRPDDCRRGEEARLGPQGSRRDPRVLRPVADRQGPGRRRDGRAGEGRPAPGQHLQRPAGQDRHRGRPQRGHHGDQRPSGT